MKKRLFTIFCAMTALFIGQSAWANQGDKTTYTADWSDKALDAIAADGSFQSKSGNGLVFVTIAGDNFIKYKENGDWMTVPHLDMGTVKEGGFYYTLSWESAETGYSMAVSEAYTRVRSYGWDAQCYWGKLASGTEIGSTISDKTFEIATSKFEEDGMSMPFRFYREGVNATFCMKELRLSVNITPDAPVWTEDTTEMKVTVNRAAEEQLNWINLPELLQVSNAAFAGSVKYELTSGNDEYVVWNADRTMFYTFKPGTYSVRAYIDMVEHAYSSSEYSADLTIEAAADEADKSLAQVFFMLDGQLVPEVEAGKFENSIVWTADNRHVIEYVYAFDDELELTKTQYGLNYVFEGSRLDTIKVNQVIGQDTIVAEVNGRKSMFLINTYKTTNHVTFILGDEDTKKAVVTAEEKASWDAEYQEMSFDAKWSTETLRTFEVSFLGVPDSLFFLYGNNSDLSQYYATLLVEYATEDGGWAEVATISGKPRQEYASYKYALLPSVNKLRFTYSGVQREGWVKNLTVTERKQIMLDEPVGDTILLSGRYSDVDVATRMDNLKWYNVAAPIQWAITGADAAQFAMEADGLNPDLDAFGENNPVTFTYQLNEVGTHVADLAIYGNDLDPKTGMPKAIYRAVLKGVTGYTADQISLEKTIPSPVDMFWQDSIANPFVVKDMAGNVLTDSVELTYEVVPENAATVADGMIYANCVGTIMVVANLQENLMMPAMADTLYMNVSEKTANVINWDIPEEIAVGSELVDLATTEDGAVMSYSFEPNVATDLGDNRIQVGIQTGKVQVTATAAQTCEHEAIDSVMTLTFKRAIKDSELVIKNQQYLGEVRVEDTIVNMVQVFDSLSGIELTPEAAQVEYSIVFSVVDDAVTVEEGNLIVMHHKSPFVLIKAVISGDTLLTRTEYIRLEVLNTFENVEFVNLPDTMLIGSQYDMNTLTWVRSGLNIDSVFTDAEMADYMLVDPATWTITPAAVGDVMLYARSMGNRDYVGPDTAMQMVTFVLPILPIDWNLGDLSNKHVDDVLYTSSAIVYTQDVTGMVYNVTEKVQKSYSIFPAEAAHVDERGDLVLDQAGDIQVIVTISGAGYQTIQDTLDLYAIGYEVVRAEIDQVLDGKHVGDKIDPSTITLYDADGNSLNQYATIDITIEPSDAAHFDADGMIVIDKVGAFTLNIAVSGVKMEAYATTFDVEVVPFVVENVIFPVVPEGGYRVDDVIYTGEFIVLDENGQDITQYAELTYVFNPANAGRVDGNGNLVLTANTTVELIVKVGGDNVIANQFSETYFVRHNEAGCYNLLVQYWSDVLVVNNNEEEHVKLGLPQFVSYQWYREEVALAGETAQDYHISAGEISGAYAYYVMATGKDGKQYMLCEKYIDEKYAPKASTSFKVYPNMVNAGSSYTVDVESNGKLYVSTNSGVSMGTYDVVKGKNTITAPASTGVYVLQFAPESGAYEVQKLIVK